jgi:ELWxxDGT repeat protein
MTQNVTLRGRARAVFGGLLVALAPLVAAAQQPSNPAAEPPLILFSASTPDTGRELWATDLGRRATRMIRDIAPGSAGSFPRDFQLLGDGRAVFSAWTADSGRELWVTNGRPRGTRMLRDIWPGETGSNPQWLTPLGDGRVLFTAETSARGNELWVTDGTRRGTRMVRDLYPGTTSGRPWGLVPMPDGRVVFFASGPGNLANGDVWVSDGTWAGTQSVFMGSPVPSAQVPSPHYDSRHDFRPVILNDRLILYTARNNFEGTGIELHATDLTPGGTRLVRDIWPGGGNSIPMWITPIGNGRAAFAAMTPEHGQELWVTNGWRGGTMLLEDIRPGPDSSVPEYLTPLGDGRVLFAAETDQHGREPWITDGTQTGTRLVRDTTVGPASGLGSSGYPIPAGSQPHFAVLEPGVAVFAALQRNWPANSTGLWRTNGTRAGTRPVADRTAGAGPRYLDHITPIGGGLALMQAWYSGDPFPGREIWRTNGGRQGTRMIRDLCPGACESWPQGFFVLRPGQDDPAATEEDILRTEAPADSGAD